MPVLVAIPIVAALIVPLAIYYLFALLMRALAQRNLFVTLAEEGTAKALIRNGAFAFFVMSYMGRSFAGALPAAPSARAATDEAEGWDILEVPGQGSGFHLPLLKGVKWIGFPPFAGAYTYRFGWSSLEEVEDPATHELVKRPMPREKIIDYILVQNDVYVTRLEKAECKDKIPLDSNLLFGGHIVNPYKALFRIERWHEATVNLVTSKGRDFFGGHTYEELVQIKEETDPGKSDPAGGSSHTLFEYFNETIAWIEKNYGFRITTLRLATLDPGSQLAVDFIHAATQLYVAQQKALADEAEGRGLASRDKQHFEAIANLPNGPELYKWTKIAESGLQTYVEGGGAKPVVSVGGNNNGGTSPTPKEPATPTTP